MWPSVLLQAPRACWAGFPLSLCNAFLLSTPILLELLRLVTSPLDDKAIPKWLQVALTKWRDVWGVEGLAT